MTTPLTGGCLCGAVPFALLCFALVGGFSHDLSLMESI